MKVPMIDLQALHAPITEKIEEAMLEVHRSGKYIGGLVVEELEKKIAEYVGTKYAVGVSSGTDALLMALAALDIGEGDFVIVPDYSFIATADVVVRTGAVPIFVDIDPQTYNLDPHNLMVMLKVMENAGREVSAIIPVHLFGRCADMGRLGQIANIYDIPIIEDAAQALGSSVRFKTGLVKKAGSMGLMGCFSFFPTKNLGGEGDGGMITTDDSVLNGKLRALRSHGHSDGAEKYHHDTIGGNFRLDKLQAAILTEKLPYLDEWNAQRRGLAARYSEALSSCEELQIPAILTQLHTYNQYVISVPDRDKLKAYLTDMGIGTAVYYPLPLHRQKCMQNVIHMDLEGTWLVFLHSIYAADHSLALPIFPNMTREQQDYVIESVKEFFEKEH